MNTRQWQKFFEKEVHTQAELKRAEKSADSFYSCAAGCKLQKLFKKPESELKKIPYQVMQSVLTPEAHQLALEFCGPFGKTTDDGKELKQIEPLAKQIFYELQAMDDVEFLNNT